MWLKNQTKNIFPSLKALYQFIENLFLDHCALETFKFGAFSVLSLSSIRTENRRKCLTGKLAVRLSKRGVNDWWRSSSVAMSRYLYGCYTQWALFKFRFKNSNFTLFYYESDKKFINILWKFGFLKHWPLKDYVYLNICDFIKSVTPLCYGFEKHMCLFENLAWQIIVNGFAFQHSFFLSFLPKDQCFERFDAQLTFLKWRALISAFCRLIFLLNASFSYRNLIWGGQNIYIL